MRRNADGLLPWPFVLLQRERMRELARDRAERVYPAPAEETPTATLPNAASKPEREGPAALRSHSGSLRVGEELSSGSLWADKLSSPLFRVAASEVARSISVAEWRDLGSNASVVVTVYIKKKSVESTATLRELRKAGIDHAVVDVTADEELRASLLEDLGHDELPVVIVAGDESNHWQGYRPDLIKGLAGARVEGLWEEGHGVVFSRHLPIASKFGSSAFREDAGSPILGRELPWLWKGTEIVAPATREGADVSEEERTT